MLLLDTYTFIQNLLIERHIKIIKLEHQGLNDEKSNRFWHFKVLCEIEPSLKDAFT